MDTAIFTLHDLDLRKTFLSGDVKKLNGKPVTLFQSFNL